MYILKWFRFIISKIYNILRYVIARILRHMCNLHIKETEISQKRSIYLYIQYLLSSFSSAVQFGGEWPIFIEIFQLTCCWVSGWRSDQWVAVETNYRNLHVKTRRETATEVPRTLTTTVITMSRKKIGYVITTNDVVTWSSRVVISMPYHHCHNNDSNYDKPKPKFIHTKFVKCVKCGTGQEVCA